jgi:phytoene dehydrogenase-like protein
MNEIRSSSARPTTAWNLYLCGTGAWPGGAVFGAAGRNGAFEVLAEH